jgi:hypothetical protein
VGKRGGNSKIFAKRGGDSNRSCGKGEGKGKENIVREGMVNETVYHAML